MNDDFEEDQHSDVEEGDDHEEGANEATNAMILNRISPKTRKVYIGLVKNVDEYARGKGFVHGFPRPFTMDSRSHSRTISLQNERTIIRLKVILLLAFIVRQLNLHILMPTPL